MNLQRAALVAVAGVGLVIAGAGAGVAAVQTKDSKAEQLLIDNAVPQKTAPRCSGNTKKEKKFLLKRLPDQKANISEVVASVACFPTAQGSPDEVDYLQFGTLNSMLNTYQASVSYLNVTTDETSPSPTGLGCPQENQYVLDNEYRGRQVCVPSTSSHRADLIWTKTAPRILSEAVLKNDPDGSRLSEWFSSDAAGPQG